MSKKPVPRTRDLAVLLALLVVTGCSLTASTEDLEGVWEASWTDGSRIEEIDPESNILTLQVGPDGAGEASGRYLYTSELDEETLQRLVLLVTAGSDGVLSGTGWWYLQVLPYGRHIRETVSVSGRLEAESASGTLNISFTTGLSDVRLTFDLARVR